MVAASVPLCPLVLVLSLSLRHTAQTSILTFATASLWCMFYFFAVFPMVLLRGLSANLTHDCASMVSQLKASHVVPAEPILKGHTSGYGGLLSNQIADSTQPSKGCSEYFKMVFWVRPGRSTKARTDTAKGSVSIAVLLRAFDTTTRPLKFEIFLADDTFILDKIMRRLTIMDLSIGLYSRVA